MKELNKTTNLSFNNIKYRIKEKLKEDKKEKRLKKTIIDFENKWYDLMVLLQNYNPIYKSFTLCNTSKEIYGFKTEIHCPQGLSFKTLDNIKDIIEDNFHCIFIYNKDRLDISMKAKFIQKLSLDKKFKPVTTKPWEIYVGDEFDGTPIIVDLTKWCHVLVSGTTGGGKSKLLDVIISTQIYNHSKQDFELYLLQLDKVDMLIYEDANVCRGFGNTLEKAEYIIKYLREENSRRDKLVAKVKKAGLGSNISDYNKYYPEDKQKTIILAIDELASLSDEGSDSKEIKKQKEKVKNGLIRLAQLTRSNNIFLILSTQRATREFVPPFVKAMCSLQISFRQNNMKSSEVAMDDPKVALGLMNRVAVYKTLDYDFLCSPFISDPIILKYIKPKLNPYHFTIFDKDNKFKPHDDKIIEVNSVKTKEKKGREDILNEQLIKDKIKQFEVKEKKLDEVLNLLSTMNKEKHIFDKVNTNIDIKDNINKIEGFVEYTPINHNKVIDKTIIKPSDQAKPRKGKVKLK